MLASTGHDSAGLRGAHDVIATLYVITTQIDVVGCCGGGEGRGEEAWNAAQLALLGVPAPALRKG